MNIPEDRKYSKSHEWALCANGEATVGISDHAQALLGDITFVDLPAVGTKVKAHAEVGSIESVKAASELYSPVSGTVTAINEELEDAPEKVNTDPYGDGWLFKVKLDAEPQDLLDAAGYRELCEKEDH